MLKKSLVWLLTVLKITLSGGKHIKPIEYKDGKRKEVIQYVDNMLMNNTVCIYQTQETMGYATRPLWDKISQTTHALRILFCELEDSDLDAIDELYMVDEI